MPTNNEFPLVPVVDECEFRHKFAKLPDHPMKDGFARCPHCLANGCDLLWERLQSAWSVIEKAESWGEAGIETMDSETVKEYDNLKIEAGYIP